MDNKCWEQCLITVLGTVSNAADWLVPKEHQKTRSTSEHYLGTVLRSIKELWASSQFVYKLSSWLTRVLVWYWFSFTRFLLICQLEGLDLTFILNDFWGISEHCLRPVLRTVFGVFLKRKQKHEFSQFFLIFGLMFF